jgi:hypothetical protein
MTVCGVRTQAKRYRRGSPGAPYGIGTVNNSIPDFSTSMLCSGTNAIRRAPHKQNFSKAKKIASCGNRH